MCMYIKIKLIKTIFKRSVNYDDLKRWGMFLYCCSICTNNTLLSWIILFSYSEECYFCLLSISLMNNFKINTKFRIKCLFCFEFMKIIICCYQQFQLYLYVDLFRFHKPYYRIKFLLLEVEQKKYVNVHFNVCNITYNLLLRFYFHF